MKTAKKLGPCQQSPHSPVGSVEDLRTDHLSKLSARPTCIFLPGIDDCYRDKIRFSLSTVHSFYDSYA